MDHFERSPQQLSYQQRFYLIIHRRPGLRADRYVSYVWDFIVFFTAALSVSLFVLETTPDYYDDTGPQGLFFNLECYAAIVLTIDLVLRFVSAMNTEDLVNMLTFFDCMSIVGFYISLSASTYGLGESSTSGEVLRFLRLCRISRLVRSFRRTRLGEGFLIVAETFVRETRQGLVMFALVAVLSVLVFSTFYYEIENSGNYWNPEDGMWHQTNGDLSPFQSMPTCFWIVSVTLTTTGYGEVVPHTGQGRAMMVIVMLSGVLFLALPTMVVSTTFEVLHRNQKRQKARYRLGKIFRKVRYAMRFTRLWRSVQNNDPEKLLHNPAKPSRPLLRRIINYMFNNVIKENDDSLQGETIIIGSTNLGSFSLKGLSGISLLQRMMEMFSGCCTSRELCESYTLLPQPGVARLQLADISRYLLLLAKAKLLRIFMINRDQDLVLACITRTTAVLLQSCLLDDPFPLVRGLTEASMIWQKTTGTVFDDFSGIDGFHLWNESQCHFSPRAIGFEYDHRTPVSQSNDIFRGTRISQPIPHRCAACVHCAVKIADLTSESQINSFEEFLMLNEEVVNRRIDSVRAALA